MRNRLTVSDVLPRPLVVLEEGMSLDFIHAITAESNFPVATRQEKKKIKTKGVYNFVFFRAATISYDY